MDRRILLPEDFRDLLMVSAGDTRDFAGMITINQASTNWLAGTLDTGTYFDTLDHFGINPFLFVNPVEELAFNDNFWRSPVDMRELQLGNSSNWETIYNSSIDAVQIAKVGGGYKLVPIPEISISLLLDVFVLAILVSTDVPESSTWKFAGNVRQQVSTGIVFGGSQDASFNRRYALFLDKINLVVFPPISTNYSISVQVPEWFPSVSLTVWRYTGPDYDSDLARIESKIDALN